MRMQRDADAAKTLGRVLPEFEEDEGVLRRLGRAANTVTARQMSLILYHAANAKGFEAFSASLPVAGRSGTLASLGRGTASEGRVRAKSGSIERVKAYCGYISARSGKRYAFALLLNNFTASSASVRAKVVRVWNKAVAK